MSWDKIGNPANVKACGKCCGLDTGYQDPDPCTPYRSGIYPNAGVKVYLSVEWTPFSVTTAGYFDRATLKANDFGNLEGQIVSGGDNGGIPTNLTVSNETIALDPFAIELSIFPDGTEGYTTNQSECYYLTPDLLTQIRPAPNPIGPSEVTAGATAVSQAGVTSISEWNLRYQDAGYLLVQGPAFADRTTVNETFEQPPHPSPSGGSRVTHVDTFGNVYASAKLTLVDDIPVFVVALYQLREHVETNQPVDENGSNSGVATVATTYHATQLFRLANYPQQGVVGPFAEIQTKHFNCSDFPVFLGDEVFTWDSVNTLGRLVGGDPEPYIFHGVPYSIAPAGGDNQPNDDPINQVWPEGYITGHPQYSKPGGPVFIMHEGRSSTGTRVIPYHDPDGFGFLVPGPDGSPITQRGSAIRRINTLGLQDLAVRLFSDPGDIA